MCCIGQHSPKPYPIYWLPISPSSLSLVLFNCVFEISQFHSLLSLPTAALSPTQRNPSAPNQHLCSSSVLPNLPNTFVYSEHFHLRSLRRFLLANQRQILGFPSSDLFLAHHLPLCHKALCLPLMLPITMLTAAPVPTLFFLTMQILNHVELQPSVPCLLPVLALLTKPTFHPLQSYGSSCIT